MYSPLSQLQCDQLAESLQRLGAARMVVGHTVHRHIAARCQVRPVGESLGVRESGLVRTHKHI
jgi:hypothetical protein